jgi:hypothetical protein
VALARIESRGKAGESESEGRVELYDLQAKEFEPPEAAEPGLEIVTTEPLSRQVEAVCNALRGCLFG